MTSLWQIILDTCFPYACILCGEIGTVWCTNCQAKTLKLEVQTCIKCKKLSICGVTHAECLQEDTANGVLALYEYRHIKPLIVQGKTNPLPKVFLILGTVLSEFIKTLHIHNDFKDFTVTWIPQTSNRDIERGFNQSQILATAFAQQLNLDSGPLLQKIKNTRSQKELNRAERKENVKNCFAPLPNQTLTQKNIILIDDVITTGATITEAVKILKQNGAAKVWVIAVAQD